MDWMGWLCRMRCALLLCKAWGITAMCALWLAAPAWAGLGASVTLVGATAIYPGETTLLQITLSNSNQTALLNNVAFANTLPGVWPNGLRIAGAATYTCTDPAGPTTSAGVGVLTATPGTQAISLTGGVIPQHSGGTDGTCTIQIPVTAGSSTGTSVTHTYTVLSNAVTGDDPGAQVNVGDVSQTVNVKPVALPTLNKNFSNSTAVLGGAPVTLTITLNNPTNPIAIPNFSITDNFPTLGGGGAVIQVATPPAATATCTGAGTPPVFTPAAGDVSLTATGGTVAANGSCTLTVKVEARHSNGQYTTGAQTNVIQGSANFTNDLGLVPANASASVTVNSPLRVSKAFAHAALASGQSDTMTITLTNDGSSALTVTTLTDSAIDGIGDATYGLKVQPGAATTCAGGAVANTAGDVGVTLTGGTIPANGSCTVTVPFIGTSQVAGVPITFTNTLAEGAVGVTAPAIVSKSASATVLVADDLVVLKSATPSGGSSVAPGNPIRFSITVNNYAGTDRANVTVSDTLVNTSFLTGTINGNDYTPSVSAGCGALAVAGAVGATTPVFTIGNLPQRISASTPGSCVVTFWAMVNPGVANGATIQNNIVASGVCHSGGALCNAAPSGPTSSSVNSAVLSAAKAFSPAGPLSEGSISRMTITLTNRSANPITGLSVTDTLPLAVSGGGQLRVATPANAASTCGTPTITAVAGSTSLGLNGGSVPARASNGTGADGTCVVQVDVVGPAGVYNNTATASGTETYADGTTHLLAPVTTNTATLTYTGSLGASKTFSPTAVSSGGRATVLIRISNGGAVLLNNVSVTDPLPAGMVVASPSNAYTTCPGSPVVSATVGGSSVSMSGATLSSGANCDVLFDVVATGAANWVNTIPAGSLTASGGVMNSSAVIGTLNWSPPTNIILAKATNPSTLTFPGQVSVLTITVTAGTQAVTGLSLTDYFTVDGTAGAALNGWAIAPSPAAQTSCPGGVVSATAGSNQLSLSGAALAANTSCTITVNVTSSKVGGITNFIPIGAVSTDQGLSNVGPANTSLTINSNLGLVKQFSPNPIKPGERARLRITFYNPTAQTVTNASVTDNLPGAMSVPAGANPTTTCAGATLTTPTASQVQITGATVAAAVGVVSGTCYAELDVLVAAQGDYTNTIPANAVVATTGGVPTTNSQPSSDTLKVKSPLVVHKAIDGKTLDSGNPVGFATNTASALAGVSTTLTVHIANPNAAPVTQTLFTDTLPSGMVIAATPAASTTCAGGTVIAAPSGTSFRLTGATVPASGSCTVRVDVLSNSPGSYTNTLASGAVTTLEGVKNEEPTSARLIVAQPVGVSKQFSPAVITPGGTSRLSIVLSNNNSTAVTLTSAFDDVLPIAPGQIQVAAVPNVSSTCTGAVTAAAGATTVRLANGATIPAGGCTLSVDVTGSTPGVHTNNIPVAALKTSLGNNPTPANATLTVSDKGYVSGRVFKDNNVTPNGSYEAGTDTPLEGVSVELRTGANCAGALVAGLTNPTTTDALGNYLFAELSAGTYSVCQPAQPTGTSNGITTAGSIVSNGGSTGTAGVASNPSASSSQIVGIVLNMAGGGQVSGSVQNNFAEVVLSQISGTVFLDQNNNGIQNGADNGLGSVSLELLNASNAVVATTTTNASGQYSFTNLQPGSYSVREPTQPAGSSNGLTVAGSVGNGGTPGSVTAVGTLPSRISAIVLPPNTSSIDNSFAEIPNGRTLSGKVFFDSNDNGVQDSGDGGIANVTLNLTGNDINGNPVSLTVNTSADGSYMFSGVPEGSSYTVTEPTQPAGSKNGKTLVGSTGGTATLVTVVPSALSAINLAAANTVSANNNFAEIPLPPSGGGGSSTPPGQPDLVLSKTHSPSQFSLGGTASYTLQASNQGEGATALGIQVVDTLPAGVTVNGTPSGSGWQCQVSGQQVSCQLADLLPAGGKAAPIVIPVKVDANLTGTTLTNTAVVSGGGEGTDKTGNNTATDVVTIIIPVKPDTRQPDLGVSKTHSPAQFSAGGSASYTLQAFNHGDGATTQGIRVVDTLPAGLTVTGTPGGNGWQCQVSGQQVSCQSSDLLAAGASTAPIVIGVTVDPSLAGKSVTNTAVVSGGGEGSDKTGNNTATDVASIPLPETPALQPDLVISKTHSPVLFGAGSLASYTLTVSNQGEAATFQGIQVSDSLPDGLRAAGTPSGKGWQCQVSGQQVSCQSSDVVLPGGRTAPIEIPVKLDASLSSRTLTNIAVVSGGGEGSDKTGNNTATDLAEVSQPDLVLSKTHSPVRLIAGRTASYTLTASNQGISATVGSVQVVDTLPAGLTVSGVPGGNGWQCQVSGQQVSCLLDTPVLPGASAAPIVIPVKLAATLTSKTVTNTAVVSGGGEGSDKTSNNTVADVAEVVLLASVHGHVWLDMSHTRRFADPASRPQPDWMVELLRDGVLLRSAQTDADGAYGFTELEAGSGYQIRFRHPQTGLLYGVAVPNEQAASFTSGVISATNPAGASQSDGTLANLTLTPGANVLEQSLPLDPAGIVYDAVTRQPVAGAVVTLRGPAGYDPSVHLVGGSTVQTTGSDGMYQFLLNPTAPSGDYSLRITTYPRGYVPAPSSLIPVCTGVLSVANQPDPALVQRSNSQPASSVPLHQPAACQGIVGGGASTTQYYFDFTLSVGRGGSANVVNNHIPLDPFRSGTLRVSKTTPLVNVSRGGLVPYTVTVNNAADSLPVTAASVVDHLPPGFRYRQGSASVDGVMIEPQVSGRDLRWPGLAVNSGQTRTVRLVLVVGAGVGEGEYTNQAWAADASQRVISNIAAATVRIVPDPTFDCSDIIGKVFDDKNLNGYQDDGEPGIANVRVVTARGLLVTTDADGRFHVPCASVPQADRGSNFVMKLDERTLPSGYRLTTENPRDVRVTRGKLVKLNFGAAIHKVFRLELDERAFVPGEDRLLDSWAAQLPALITALQAHPAVLRLAYSPLSRQASRLDALQAELRRRYAQRDGARADAPPLLIELEPLSTPTHPGGAQ